MSDSSSSVSSYVACMKGRCPHCGDGPLYVSFLKMADRCETCGLDYTFVETGDGPAFFAICAVGFLVAPFVVMFQIIFKPAVWAHFLIWGPLLLLSSVLFLRLFKSLFCAIQYGHWLKEQSPEKEDGASGGTNKTGIPTDEA